MDRRNDWLFPLLAMLGIVLAYLRFYQPATALALTTTYQAVAHLFVASLFACSLTSAVERGTLKLKWADWRRAWRWVNPLNWPPASRIGLALSAVEVIAFALGRINL
jgi:hypothetical protein